MNLCRFPQFAGIALCVAVGAAAVSAVVGPAAGAMLPGQGGDGVADLFVGGRDLILRADGPAVNGFILTSAAGLLAGEPYVFARGLFVTDGDRLLADQFGYALADVHDLGRVLAAGADLAALAADLTLTYTVAGQAGVRYGTILPATPGDCDLDGQVGPGDLLRLEPALGTTPAVWVDGDFNGNGAVDCLDYITLKRHYGPAEPPAASGEVGGTPTVPEPATLVMLAIGAGAAGLARRRHQGGQRPSRPLAAR